MNTPLTLEEIKQRQARVHASPVHSVKPSQHNCVKCQTPLVRIGFTYGCTECWTMYREEDGMLKIIEVGL